MNTKNIIFVDDEIAILDALKRALRKERLHWNMDFVNSGQEVLALCEKKPVDLVVTDMCMPQMDGAELLQALRKKYPDTLRIVLTGHADSDMVFRTLMTAHQYLVKPFENEVIRNTIEESISLRDDLSHQVREIISEIHQLPSLPNLYQEVIGCLEEKNASLTQVAQIIEKDISMSAKILNIVNSSFFGITRKIMSVNEGVNYLGLDVIMALILNDHLFSSLDNKIVKQFQLDHLWEFSFKTGNLAKEICATMTDDVRMINQSMISGILHLVGKIVLAVNFTEQYQECYQSSETERNTLGHTHAEIGAYLLSTWGLPDSIIKATCFYERPKLAKGNKFSPLTATYAANKFLKEEAIDIEYLQYIGCQDILPTWSQLAAKFLTQG